MAEFKKASLLIENVKNDLEGVCHLDCAESSIFLVISLFLWTHLVGEGIHRP